MRGPSLSGPHASEKILSSGEKNSADDTVVKMKTLRRSVDVAIIDS